MRRPALVRRPRFSSLLAALSFLWCALSNLAFANTPLVPPALERERAAFETAITNAPDDRSKVPLYEKLVNLLIGALGPEHPDTATALNNLALTYSRLAQYDKALPLKLRALAINEKVLGPEHPNTATTLGNLALTYSRLAQYDKALPLEQRALAIREKLSGPEHPDTALALNNLASTYSDLAQYDKALPLQQRALAIYERTLGVEHPETGDSYYFLGAQYEQQALPTLAIIFFKQAVNVRQSVRQTVRKIGADALESYTKSADYQYQQLASLLVSEGRLAEAQFVLDLLKEDEQFEFVRRSAGQVNRRQIDYTPTEQAWLKRYRAVADRLFVLGQEEQALQKAAKPRPTPEQQKRQRELAMDLAAARSAFEASLEQLRKELATDKTNRSGEIVETSVQALNDLQDLLRGLGPDTALVTYYILENQVGMLVTTAGAQKAYQSKIEARSLNRKINDFANQLRSPTANPRPLAEELYQLLFASIAQDLDQAGIRTVMVSPDGVLRYLPFAALHDGKDYLLQRFRLPVFNVVERERLREPVLPKWSAVGLGVTRQHGEFKPLPAVKAEMESIIKTGERGLMPGEIYLDDAFTAKRLQEVGRRRFPVMHIASHFRFSPGTELNSYLLLGDGQRLSLGDLRTGDYRFDGVDLLTLSACETGRGGGRDAQGREIEGFGVIAQQQGAKAVLATLWNVADQSTALLMADTYRRRQEGGASKIEALRQAQIALQNQPQYAHPYYWAPFILTGNWK